MYNPGTHLIASLRSQQLNLLSTYQDFKTITDKLINDFDLKRLGEVYHNFEPAGYTGVVCLSESHISVHTWPEYGLLNMDIYLSNHEKTNDDTVRKIFEAYVSFFSAEISQIQTLLR